MLLLLFNSKSGIGNYTGKRFEYFAAKRPILAFGPEDSDVKKLIEKTKAGMYFSYNETKLKDDILDLFKNKNQFNFENAESFSREKLTKDLSELLNNI